MATVTGEDSKFCVILGAQWGDEGTSRAPSLGPKGEHARALLEHARARQGQVGGHLGPTGAALRALQRWCERGPHPGGGGQEAARNRTWNLYRFHQM